MDTKLKRKEKIETLFMETDNIPPPGTRLRFRLTGVHSTKNQVCKSYISPVVVKQAYPFSHIYRNVYCVTTTAEKVKSVCLWEFMLELLNRHRVFLTRIMFSVYPKEDEQGCDVLTEEVCNSDKRYKQQIKTNNMCLSAYGTILSTNVIDS